MYARDYEMKTNQELRLERTTRTARPTLIDALLSSRRLRVWVLAFITILILHYSSILHAQTISGVVNSYARVTAIDTCYNTVSIASTSGLSIGDRVLIIQMKGATI